MTNRHENSKGVPEGQKYDTEIGIRQAELELKREELSLKREENKYGGRLQFKLKVGILTALITLIITFVFYVIQGFINLQIERQKLQSTLILKAIETGDKENSAKNLIFLAETGLIPNYKEKIIELAKNPENVPVLPAITENTEKFIEKHLTDAGFSITQLQIILKKKGLYKGEITGKYDSQTVEAIRKYQQSKSIIPTGVIGPKTARRLLEEKQ